VDLMLKISSEDITMFKQECNVEDEELGVDDMKDILERLTGDQLNFNDIMLFGNGKILNEQI